MLQLSAHRQIRYCHSLWVTTDAERLLLMTVQNWYDGRSTAMSNNATAIAVREHGNDKHAKIIIFLYNVPGAIREILSTWIAVSRGTPLTNVLFNERTNLGRIVTPLLIPGYLDYLLEAEVWHSCIVLTLGQRCADSFLLRQFRITGTNAGRVLMEISLVRTYLGLSELHGRTEKTASQWLNSFCDGWFSGRVSVSQR